MNENNSSVPFDDDEIRLAPLPSAAVTQAPKKEEHAEPLPEKALSDIALKEGEESKGSPHSEAVQTAAPASEPVNITLAENTKTEPAPAAQPLETRPADKPAVQDEIIDKSDIKVVAAPPPPPPPPPAPQPQDKSKKKSKAKSSAVGRTGCLIFLLILAALIGAGIYFWPKYQQQARAKLIQFELKMNFRLFEPELSKLNRDSINAWDAKKRTEVHKTAETGNLDRLKKLLEAGGDLSALDDTKNSVFHYAAKSGNAEMMKFLAKKQPSLLLQPNAEGTTPLHVAAKYNHDDVVEFLLLRGADPEAADNDGSTPAQLTSSDSVKKLLAKKRKVKKRK